MIQPEPLLRPRLMRWLTRALRSGHVCIEAPGGYGKSTLLRSLLTQRAHCYYFDLTYSDADLQVLQARLADLPKQADVTILLDDLHHIADAEPTLHWLFQQMMPLQARFVLSGRHVPLPSVNTPIGWLRTRDLAFSAQETNVWFRDPKWQTITNGWPLALMLARQSASDSTMIDPTFAKQQLFDSLAYRYLAGLPTVLIHFMQTTAVPLRFNFALAEELWHDAKVDRGNTQDTFAIDSGSGLRSAHSLFTELQQRNLFLEPVTTQPGWFKYHDLIREFLVDQLPMDPSRVYMRVIDWFNRQGDFEMAIEHALTSQLYSRAIELIKQIPGNFVREQARIHTYHRWFASLPLGLRQRHPILMVRLGQYLLEAPEFSQEAWGLVNQAAEIAEQMGDVTTLIQARTQLGRFHYYAGDYPEAQRILEQVIAEPRTTAADLSYVLRLLGVTLAESGYYRQARQVHLRAIKLAHSRGDGNEENTLRQNLAGTVLNPLGEFNIAEEHLRAAFDFYRHAPGTQIRCLTMLCDVQMLKGDWQTLTQTLDQIDLLRDQLETVERGEQVFSLFYRSAIETAGGNLNAARKLYEEFRTLSLEERAMLQISRAWLEVWLCRREGRIEDAIRAADDLLSSTIQMPYYRAQIALMRDIALYMRLSPAEPALDLHQESANLIGWRARADLVHLRA